MIVFTKQSVVVLAVLSLLFVPAGVGVVQKLHLLAEHGIALLLILVVAVRFVLLLRRQSALRAGLAPGALPVSRSCP